MKNPFTKNQYILPVASINNVYVDDILVGDLFRLDLIVEEIAMNQTILQVDNINDKKELFEAFQHALLSDDEEQSTLARKIAHKYGARLAQMIVTLKKPSEQSKENRKNWRQAHWAYWASIKKIIFVGGLSLPALTRIFMSDIKNALKLKDIDLEVSFIEGSINLGTQGLSTKASSGESLIFDFGQTNIKRRHHVKDGEDVVLDMILPCISSKFLYYKHQTNDELYNTAKKLDEYIQQVLIDTIDVTMFEGKQIHIAIANYIYEGRIYANRGGYAKLGLLNEQYNDHLMNELYKKTGHQYDIKLYHDTTAVSYFFEEEQSAAVISIGTAFGVAFLGGKNNAR